MISVALHLHSTWSDGEFSLPELREIFVALGCRAALVTDHAPAFDEAGVARYRAECARLSDDAFRFVPGLEFQCIGRLHMIGYGVTELTPLVDPVDVADHIRSNGGVAVVAHPRTSDFPWIETWGAAAHGIEVWNTKYDGRYAPRAATFELLQRLRRRNAGVHAFCGIDLHWRKQFRELFTFVACAGNDADRILEALRQGRFEARHPRASIGSDGVLPPAVLARFGRVQRRSDALRGALRFAKRLADRAGAPVPRSLKARLRRWF